MYLSMVYLTGVNMIQACWFFIWLCLVVGDIPLRPDNVTFRRGMDADPDSRDRNFTISEEKRLTQYLLWKYSVAGRGGRPVINTTQATLVEFGLGLIQMDLDERSKILITSMWTRLKWQDMYLTWDPNDFGGVTAVRLESDQVWLPDIMLYNTADPENAARNALVVVFYDGTLQWIPHQIFKSSCSIDVTNFPFDEQQCHMWFGSWTHSLSDIDLNLAFDGGIDLSTFQSDYKDSCEWDIVRPEAERKLLPENDPNPIVVLSFTLHLQRKLVFSSYILTLPCVFLTTLTLVVFWLPADRPDRTSLAMNLFASFMVLLLILVEAAPPTASSIPVLGVYYCFNMVIIMMSIFLSTMVVNINRAGNRGKPLPRWINILVLKILAKLVCICPPSKCYHRINQKRSPPESTCNDHDVSTGARNCNHVIPETQQLLQNTTGGRCDNTNQKSTAHDQELSQYTVFHSQVEDMRQSLQELVRNMVDKDASASCLKKMTLEWQEVGRVLDRIFFIMYIIIIILSLLTLFPRPPNMTFFWETPVS